MGEAAVYKSDIPYVIVQSARIDDVRTPEDLDLKLEMKADRVAAAVEADSSVATEAEGAVGVRRDDAKKRSIHPRDLAFFMVSSLAASNDKSVDGLDCATVEAWTYVD